MKYRTKRVQIRQKIGVVLIVLSTLGITATSAISAIAEGDKQLNQLKQQLEQPPVTAPVVPGDLWVTGDSVILGIRFELDARENIGLINARVGRQAPELLEVIKNDKANMVGEIAEQPRIIVVNTAVPRGWRDENNALIAKYAAQYGARLIDWASISAEHPEYFGPDGVHLVPAGVRAYVDAIAAQLGDSQ
jgi:hypothetical protein